MTKLAPTHDVSPCVFSDWPSKLTYLSYVIVKVTYFVISNFNYHRKIQFVKTNWKQSRFDKKPKEKYLFFREQVSETKIFHLIFRKVSAGLKNQNQHKSQCSAASAPAPAHKKYQTVEAQLITLISWLTSISLLRLLFEALPFQSSLSSYYISINQSTQWRI